LTAPEKTINPRIIKDKNCGHNTSKPTPFKKMPLIITKKYLRGFK